MPISFMKVAGTSLYSEVNTYADLPAASLTAGITMLVLQETGTWILGTLKRAGLYYSNGSTWSRLGNAQNFFYDDKFAIKNVDDNSKQFQIDVSEVPTATVRAVKVPPEDGTLLTDSGQIALGVKLIGNNIIVTGCQLSINTDTTKFDISSGVFYMVDNYTDPLNPVYVKYEFAGATGLTPTYAGSQPSSYIAFDVNGDIVQLGYFPVDQEDIRDYLALGALVHPSGTTIISVSNSTNSTFSGIGFTLSEFGQAVGRIAYGNIFSPAGTDLTIKKSAGQVFGIASNLKADPKNPNYLDTPEIDPVTFIYTYRNGSGGWTTVGGQTDIDPTTWDNGTGTLDTVNGSNWSIKRIYYASGSNTVYIQEGQYEYNNESLALDGLDVDPVEINPVLENLIFRGWIVVKGSCTDLSDTSDARFIKANKFGDTSSASGGVGLTTVSLQQAYQNSSEPEIVTDSTRQAVSIQGGTGTNTDKNFVISNNAGTETLSIQADGTLSLGNSSVDGSWRILLLSGAFTIQKRVSGSWVSQFEITGP